MSQPPGGATADAAGGDAATLDFHTREATAYADSAAHEAETPQLHLFARRS